MSEQQPMTAAERLALHDALVSILRKLHDQEADARTLLEVMRQQVELACSTIEPREHAA
jgi:hypothetical protein